MVLFLWVDSNDIHISVTHVIIERSWNVSVTTSEFSKYVKFILTGFPKTLSKFASCLVSDYKERIYPLKPESLTIHWTDSL